MNINEVPADAPDRDFPTWGMVKATHGNRLVEVLRHPESGATAEIWQRWYDEDALKQSCYRPADMYTGNWDSIAAPKADPSRYGVVVRDNTGNVLSDSTMEEGKEVAILAGLNAINPNGGPIERTGNQASLGADHWISRQDASKATGLSLRAIDHLPIGREKVGHYVFFDRRDIDNYLWENRKK